LIDRLRINIYSNNLSLNLNLDLNGTKFTMASNGSKLILNSALRAAVHVNSSKLPSEFLKSSAAFLSAAPSGGKHVLPDLPYDYSALERECFSCSLVMKE
jgi:hypothetical protein